MGCHKYDEAKTKRDENCATIFINLALELPDQLSVGKGIKNDVLNAKVEIYIYTVEILSNLVDYSKLRKNMIRFFAFSSNIIIVCKHTLAVRHMLIEPKDLLSYPRHNVI